MENKPIVTCHGNQMLFSKLHPSMKLGLPHVPIAWQRTFSRTERHIPVQVDFVPFNSDIIPNQDDWTLLGRPYFHIYWSDCDIDTYKAEVKQEIASWISVLEENRVYDWLIVIVVNDENKVKTKILRNSVYDKVKTDFCSRHTERCIMLADPLKNDWRRHDGWSNLLARIRELIIASYGHNIGLFEENMRQQREERQHQDWSFSQYFLLQEELAFMFEMLGLHKDALIQYDELDALLTQFIVNHAAGDHAPWLAKLASQVYKSWDALCLSQPINIEKRQLIRKNKATLLDIRTYLFSRQCTLLILMDEGEEVSQRGSHFLRNTSHEVALLDIKLCDGALDSWTLMGCLEILNTCQASGAPLYSLHSAILWDYARLKIYNIGSVCFLLPVLEPSSFHLKLVVDILAGFADELAPREPLEKLRETLSSKGMFQKHYLELSELAMGTYKHIGRLRAARKIGRDLAEFYISFEKFDKAEGFLLDSIKMFELERWFSLADDNRLKLLTCYEENSHKFGNVALQVISSDQLSVDTRNSLLSNVVNCQEQLSFPCEPCLVIKNIVVEQKIFTPQDKIVARVELISNFPCEIRPDNVQLDFVLPVGEGADGNQVVDNNKKLENAALECEVTSCYSFHLSDALIKCGENNFPITGTIVDVGDYSHCWLSIHLNKLHLKHFVTLPHTVQVNVVKPKICLKMKQDKLVQGIEEIVVLEVFSGSSVLRDQKLMLASKEVESLSPDEIFIEYLESHQLRTREVSILCTSAHAMVHISNDVLGEFNEELLFSSPLQVTHHVRTCRRKKFLQVIVSTWTNEEILVRGAGLTANDADQSMIVDKFQPLICSSTCPVHLTWKLDCLNACTCSLRIDFTCHQRATHLVHRFQLDSLQTLYSIQSSLVPCGPLKKCYVGSKCRLQVAVQVAVTKEKADGELQYEIDSGRDWNTMSVSSGRIKLSSKSTVLTVDIVPLTAGTILLPKVVLSGESVLSSEVYDASYLSVISVEAPIIEPLMLNALQDGPESPPVQD